jgi:hypothetical protein
MTHYQGVLELSFMNRSATHLPSDIPADLIGFAADVLAIDRNSIPPRLNKFQVANLFGVKPETTDVWACTGRHSVPFIKIGRHRQYPTIGVLRVMAKHWRGQSVYAA